MTTGWTMDGRRTDRRREQTQIWPLRRANKSQ